MNGRNKMLEHKVALVTGASSGLGRSTAFLLADNGFTVFGTSRQPDKSRFFEYETLPLDVRSDESAQNCIRTIMERTGRLDVLINNAGYALAGGIEETSILEAKAQFETNFFGAVRMVRAVLPIMRKQQGGQIINISSLAGLMGLPFLGFYTASKYAIEGYTETLRHEVRTFNIRVSLIEPSFFKTDLARSTQRSADPIKDYSAMHERAIQASDQSVQEGDNPDRVAELILSVIKSKYPRLRYRVGKQSIWLPRVKAFSPESAFEAGVRRNFHLDR